jgi:hypothetical protein
MQWLKTILITELSFVNDFKGRWTRMHSLWTRLFGLVRQHSSSMVQWTDIIPCTGLVKIWQGTEFTRTYSLVWCVIQGYCGTVLLWRDSSYWCWVPEHAWGIHCARHSSAVWRWVNLLPTRWDTPTLPTWCQGLSWWQFRRLVDRPKQKCWVHPMFAWFNSTWLLLVGLLEGFSVQYKTSNASRTKAWNWIVVCSHPSRYFGERVLLSYLSLSTVPRS